MPERAGLSEMSDRSRHSTAAQKGMSPNSVAGPCQHSPGNGRLGTCVLQGWLFDGKKEVLPSLLIVRAERMGFGDRLRGPGINSGMRV